MPLIADLEATRDETLRYFDLGDHDLDRSYAPGKWSIRFLLHHLADSETVLYERIRRVLCEPRQVVWFYDQDAWARGLDYARIPLDLSRQMFEVVRRGIIYHARLRYEKDGAVEFVHSTTGLRTLKQEFDKVAEHNAHHLGQIRAALGAARSRELSRLRVGRGGPRRAP